MFFLEVIIGQYTSEGGITCWEKICPLFSGEYVARVTWVHQVFSDSCHLLGVSDLLTCISARCRAAACWDATVTKRQGEGRYGRFLAVQKVPLGPPLWVFG